MVADSISPQIEARSNQLLSLFFGVVDGERARSVQTDANVEGM